MKPLADICLSDQDIERLAVLRGGCSCHISPLCRAHTDPLDAEEAEALGLLGSDELVDVPY